MPSTPPLPQNLFSLEFLGQKAGITRLTFPISNCWLFSCVVEGSQAQPGAQLAAGHIAGHLCVLPLLRVCVFILCTTRTYFTPSTSCVPKLVLHPLSSA